MKILSTTEIQDLFRELSEQLKLIEITLDKNKLNKKPLSIIYKNAWKLKEYSQTATKKLNQVKSIFTDTFD
ncbi:MAG: hypothetical protein HeimC3_01400 [Candidatus Heimdallarchaeota archaeon LC_3]|nr:MAG: hypothetical protein HeimC3_01400 [Candidatus Heimdallarchaeota archaeon LC_3]